MEEMIKAEELSSKLDGLGYERIEAVHGSTYKDNSTVVIMPTRGTIHWKVMQAVQNLVPLMNQKKAFMYAVGHEVGQAYNTLIRNILADPNLSKWKYVLTLEDDNMPMPDAHVRLIETIESGGYDAVSGIYFTKGDFNMPQAYGDPNRFRNTGELEFRPRNIVECLTAGKVMEVNGIAMGCALWKMDIFRDIPEPWFVTCNDWTEGAGGKCFTQDLYFCEKGRRAGKKFAVDFRVRVGHLDPESGIVY
jgi:hypothetical protein